MGMDQNPYESPRSRTLPLWRIQHRFKFRSLLWRGVVVVPALLCLYVLSLGPALYLLNAGFIPHQPVVVFYAPLVWAAEHCEALDYALKRYIAMWLGWL